MDRNKLWKILKEMEIPDHLTCLLRNLYADQEATELDMEQRTGSKLGKQQVKAVYCHSAFLTYMQSTTCEMPDWMTLHDWKGLKLESSSPLEQDSSFPGKISTTSLMQMILL